jgi:hypothetical protein
VTGCSAWPMPRRGRRLTPTTGASRSPRTSTRMPGAVRWAGSSTCACWRCASGRSHALTSTASITRPSTARGSVRSATDVRNRCTSMRPSFNASYIAPCPRRCSGANVNPTKDFTGPSVHNKASASSNNSRRNPANFRAAATEHPSCTLFNETALGIDFLPSTRSSTKGCPHDQPGSTNDRHGLNNKLKRRVHGQVSSSSCGADR